MLDVATFQEVLASFPAGVVIVTAADGDGTPYGLTMTAFCSVSAHPPLVLVCVDQASTTLPAVQVSRTFTVNVLAAGRDELALRFASKREDKFAGLEWQLPQTVAGGGPILTSDAGAYLVCRVEQELTAGDHQVFIGEAVDAGVREQAPLLYHNRDFASIAVREAD